MNLEGLKKSMKQQEGQRSVKKYIVLFILLVLVVIFIVLKGADIESVCNEKCESEMADGRPWSGSSV
jgi:cell division protein FtsI/penicillin-binding protein 2